MHNLDFCTRSQGSGLQLLRFCCSMQPLNATVLCSGQQFFLMFKKKKYWLVFRHLQISFTVGMMIEITKLYIFLCLNDLHLCSRSQLYEKSQTLVSHFLRNFTVDLDEIYIVATICWFVEAHAKCCLPNIQRRELC